MGSRISTLALKTRPGFFELGWGVGGYIIIPPWNFGVYIRSFVHCEGAGDKMHDEWGHYHADGNPSHTVCYTR